MTFQVKYLLFLNIITKAGFCESKYRIEKRINHLKLRYFLKELVLKLIIAMQNRLLISLSYFNLIQESYEPNKTKYIFKSWWLTTIYQKTAKVKRKYFIKQSRNINQIIITSIITLVIESQKEKTLNYFQTKCVTEIHFYVSAYI